MINIERFKEIEIRVGKITDVEDHPYASKPMYKLTVDVGDAGKRTIVAGIKGIYTKEELIGKYIVIAANLEPKAIAGVVSEGMLLAAEDDKTISILTVDRPVKEGSLVR